MAKIVVGVMGAGESATSEDIEVAYRLGKSIAENGWVLLTGGRTGVMDAASRGAKAAGGLTVGILPNQDTTGMSEAIDLAIITDMGNARNNINVLSSKVVIACGIGLGTASEIALALKNGKSVVLLNTTELTYRFFNSLAEDRVFIAQNVDNAIALTKEILLDLK